MAQRGSTSPWSRRIYLKGSGTQRYLRIGAFNYRSPPLRRKKSPTTNQYYAQETMKVAAAFLKMMTASERQQCSDLAGNSGFTWKDSLYASFYGTGIEFIDDSGMLWQGRRVLASEIQQLLDSISSNPGSILVRTNNGWAALYPGTANEVLTMRGDTGLPDWQPNSGGGGASAITPAIIQSSTIAVESGVANFVMPLGAPTPGNGLLCLTTHWANAVTLAQGWSSILHGPSASQDAYEAFFKIATAADGATLSPSTSSTGWCGLMVEIDGAFLGTINGMFPQQDGSGITLSMDAANPIGQSALVGFFAAQDRAATTIAISGSPVTLLDYASTTSSTLGGPRSVQSFAAAPIAKGGYPLLATYGSSGVNMMMGCSIGPHISTT